MNVLEVQDVSKSFGSVKAVQRIRFSVCAGEVFTIIGPNGAGKTTTLEMIEGLQRPDGGTISVLGMHWGKDDERIKMRIGVQPQSSALFDLLTVEENLALFASFYDRHRPVADIMDLINLTEHRRKRVKTLSGGQKQRLAIGLGLINDPDIIFLDEPTTGLDPQARRNIWDIVLRLKSIGKTTVLTTHYMEEAEQLSDRVCIIDAGRIIAVDSPKSLVGRLTREREIRMKFADAAAAEAAAEAAEAEPNVTRIERQQERLRIWSGKPEATMYHLFGFTSANGMSVEQISIREMSLEDVFLAFTGREWRD